jgi:hypothetical protein
MANKAFVGWNGVNGDWPCLHVAYPENHVLAPAVRETKSEMRLYTGRHQHTRQSE